MAEIRRALDQGMQKVERLLKAVMRSNEQSMER